VVFGEVVEESIPSEIIVAVTPRQQRKGGWLDRNLLLDCAAVVVVWVSDESRHFAYMYFPHWHG